MMVRPAQPGAIVRDPKTKIRLPPEGRRVPDSSFWRRRLLDGDVVLVTDQEKENPANGQL